MTTTGHVGVKHQKTLPLAADRNGVIGQKVPSFPFYLMCPNEKFSLLHILKEKNNCVSIYTQEFGPLIQCLFSK